MHKMLAFLERLVYNMCVSKKKTKEYPMSDLIIIAEMLETVMGNEDLRERVLDSMDLSDDEAWRVVEEFTKSLEVK